MLSRLSLTEELRGGSIKEGARAVRDYRANRTIESAGGGGFFNAL
jgi:hypothetical protein